MRALSRFPALVMAALVGPSVVSADVSSPWLLEPVQQSTPIEASSLSADTYCHPDGGPVARGARPITLQIDWKSPFGYDRDPMLFQVNDAHDLNAYAQSRAPALGDGQHDRMASGPSTPSSAAPLPNLSDSSHVGGPVAPEPPPAPTHPANARPGGFMERHPALATSLLIGAALIGDALIASAAYENDEGRTLAGIDAGFGVLALVTPSDSQQSTAQVIALSACLMTLGGAVVAGGSNGASPDQLFVTNLVGFPAALLLGNWIGGWFDRRPVHR